MKELWDDYLQYLIWRCGLEHFSEYSRLFEILHRIDFTWLIDRDDNREADGIELRDDYNISGEYGYIEREDFFEKPCSVMEMLVGLAIRVDDEFIGNPSEEHPEEFFMEMIKNLGLDGFKNNRIWEDKIFSIVMIWLNREFDRHGNGSPFPVRRDRRNQRNLEIWDQMNSYINENYI